VEKNKILILNERLLLRIRFTTFDVFLTNKMLLGEFVLAEIYCCSRTFGELSHLINYVIIGGVLV